MKILRRLTLLFCVLTLGMTRSTGHAATLDTYGYILQPISFDWDDITTSSTLNFPSSNNSFVGPVNLGFSFPFYENNYSAVYISTNGLLSFGQGVSLPVNLTMPNSPPPNNLIAPLWADLDVGGVNSGSVYTLQRGTAPDREFVIEYYGVTYVNTPADLLQFEVTLHENGDICVQYLALDGDTSSAVAGIEDIDGVDGLDANSLIDIPIAYCFFRPPDGARSKVIPAADAGFVTYGSTSFPFTVVNTGDFGTDVYDLGFSAVPGTWTADFSTASHQPLQDSNGNGILDTGPIQQGQSADFIVNVHAPVTAVAGDYTDAAVSIISQMNSAAMTTLDLQIAVSTSFVQAYQELQDGLRLEYLSSTTQLLSPNLLSGNITGFSITGNDAGNFLLFSEDTYLNSNIKSVTDIEYFMLDSSGQTIFGPQKLTNNNNATLQTLDRVVGAAGLSNGQTAVVFIRNITDNGVNPVEVNSNLFAAVINANGGVGAGPVNLTQNTQWRNINDLNIPVFYSPRIAEVGDRIAVTWIDDRLQSGAQLEDDVVLSIMTTSGTITVNPAVIANSTAGGSRYDRPAVTGLTNNRVLISYFETDSAGNPVSVHYTVRDQNNNTVKADTVIPGSGTDGMDAVQLSNGSIILSWVDALSRQVNYALLNGSYNLTFGPVELTSPQNRKAANISVTQDPSGRPLLTWVDGSASQFVFYALLDSAGTVVTPPMAFRSTSSPSAYLQVGGNGGGNAPFSGIGLSGNMLFLPLINRK